MRIVMFYHSLLSDWNHGNAHFLRGVASELIERGHDVDVFEPRDGWSVTNMLATETFATLDRVFTAYPQLVGASHRYDPATLDLDEALDGADLVIVHEWSDHALVARIGAHRASSRSYGLLFHDTHHRSVTDSGAMAAYDLGHYDGVLAYGAVIREIYLDRGWAARAWTWHEAADVRVFKPLEFVGHEGDLVWIGNWGDDERAAELDEFLLEPVRRLRLDARVYGVRYPDHALDALTSAGISYGGWLPNYEAPRAFARHAVTVHIPRRPYVQSLPGIPTIRPFEALACGIPLVSSPWDDVEGLFTPGRDYLVAENGSRMREHLRDLLADPELAASLAEHGRSTILARHTCAHRVDELMTIHEELTKPTEAAHA